MDFLNPEQRRAATHGHGPLLVIAGAGTGKTRTLAARVEHLVASGTPPERILLLTFSRQAAREMLSRVRAAEGRRAAPWGGTFHAIAHRLLRIYAGRSIPRCPQEIWRVRPCWTRTGSSSRRSTRPRGLEWDAVTVIHAADGCIPSDLSTGDSDDIEEERRLFYVALTRARKHLAVVAPLRFHVRDKQPTDRHMYAPLTRFLPPRVLERFEQTAEQESPLETPVAATAADAVREKVLRRWD